MGRQGHGLRLVALGITKVLALAVADEDQAWAINHAKKALSAGDERAAYTFLSGITNENRRTH
jgi:hypothetical protein